MISTEKALQIIFENISTELPAEEISLDESLGRILREDISSDINIPLFNNSAMDGYALRSEDVKDASISNPVELKIIDEIPAGYLPEKKVESGETSLIMTGAPIPEGADTVVIVEHSLPADSSDTTKIFFAGKPGDNIRIEGEDIKKGEIVIKAGIIIKASDIGMLAALGKSKIKVSKRPVIAILASGDELVEVDQPITPGKIRCSNNFMLAGLVRKYGGIPVNLGISRDKRDDMVKHLEEGKKYDIIITTGGISVGKYDIVRDTLESLGGEFKLWKVAMKPGKPLAFCLWNNKPVFGLPGNPISSAVSFEQFVRPAMLKMMKKEEISLPIISATIQNKVKKKTGIKYFARVRVYVENGELMAEVPGPHGSNMLKPLSRSNGLAVFDEESTGAEIGDRVSVQMIDKI